MMHKEISIQVGKKRIFFVCLMLVLLSAPMAGFCSAQSPFSIQFDSERLPWRRLSYKADNFFGKMTTDVRLEALSAKAAADLLLPVPKMDGLQPSDATVISITADFNINPLIGPREILNTRSLCDPSDAAALQIVRLRQGYKVWQKSYRFQPDGVYHERKRPAGNRKQELPPNQWKTYEQRMYEFHPSRSECPAVLEPSELLYLASVVDFRGQKSPLNLCVFDQKQLHRITMTAGGTRQLKVNYLEKSPGKQTRREGTVDVIKITFQPNIMGPADTKLEEFSFMGLQGDFEMYVDGATHIPVQVDGKLPGIGKLQLKLYKVEF